MSRPHSANHSMKWFTGVSAPPVSRARSSMACRSNSFQGLDAHASAQPRRTAASTTRGSRLRSHSMNTRVSRRRQKPGISSFPICAGISCNSQNARTGTRYSHSRAITAQRDQSQSGDRFLRRSSSAMAVRACETGSRPAGSICTRPCEIGSSFCHAPPGWSFARARSIWMGCSAFIRSRAGGFPGCRREAGVRGRMQKSVSKMTDTPGSGDFT